MRSYKVIQAFKDKITHAKHDVGTVYESNDDSRIDFLQKTGYLSMEEHQEEGNILSGSVESIKKIMEDMSTEELFQLKEQEEGGQKRKGVLDSIQKLLKASETE